MTTILDKEIKRQVAVDGADYILAINAEGFRLTGKGRRKPEVALSWRDLLNGEAAMAVALNASLLARPPERKTEPEGAPLRSTKASPRKRPRK